MRGEARILFVGDMMFDRTIRKIAEVKGYDHLFSCVKDYMSGFDLVVGNLEGPITTRESYSLHTKPGEANNTTFTFAPAVAESLALHGIKAVSLGNNHIFDMGRVGADSTASFLDNEGIAHFGSPGKNLATTTKVGKIQVTFVAFNQFLGEGDPEKTVAQIWKARASDLVVVFAHWGDEYVPATVYVKALAHRFIDAGADLVIGAHPHVIQEYEIYEGKHIFYSLGNFIFDQYWMDEVRTGAGVEVSVDDGAVSVRERKFEILRDGRTCLKES